MVSTCIITDNKFVIALKARIPRNPHIFNGMGNILSAIGMTPLNFNGYRNIPPFFIGYRNGEGGLQPPHRVANGFLGGHRK